MIHKLGNDLTKSVKLNLLPGIKLAPGYWQSEITYVTSDQKVTVYNSSTFNHGGEPTDFDVLVGQDVYNIVFRCHRHNSFPGNPNTIIHYTMRVDHLILLNFVYTLVGSTIKIK